MIHVVPFGILFLFLFFIHLSVAQGTLVKHAIIVALSFFRQLPAWMKMAAKYGVDQ